MELNFKVSLKPKKKELYMIVNKLIKNEDKNVNSLLTHRQMNNEENIKVLYYEQIKLCGKRCVDIVMVDTLKILLKLTHDQFEARFDKEILFYWFKRFTINNQLNLHRDIIPNNFDILMVSVEEDIRSNLGISEKELRAMEIMNRTDCSRYTQSTIEVIGKVIGDDQVDVMAMLIGQVIEKFIDRISQVQIVELLYQYFQQKINYSANSTQQRNISIVLSHLIKYSQFFDYKFIKYIRNEVFTYLTRTLNKTNDKWARLFALIGLENLDLSVNEKKKILKIFESNKLFEIDNFQQKDLQILNSTNTKFVDYQFALCAQLYNESRLTHGLVDFPDSLDELYWQTTLNASDQSKELKLSRDRLSARSDWGWQSVRSTSFDIDYYEVLLLTSGPMRIGWATNRTNLDRTEIGDDQFSIALDGYNQCVWYNGVPFLVQNMSNRWRAGDIVGCSFDKKQRTFYFTLNGQSLAFDCSIYISSQPYYAATSLSSHQQCYINFGQCQFNCDLFYKKDVIFNSSFSNKIFIDPVLIIELNFENNTKLEELHKIVNDWIMNRDKNDNTLLAYRQMNDQEWVEREVMCYVLRYDVFHLVDWKKLFMLMKINLISSANVHKALQQLVDLLQRQVNTKLPEWKRYMKMCDLIKLMLKKCKNSMIHQTCVRMLNYLTKIIETCEHEETIVSAWRALAHFPFSKNDFESNNCQSSLIKLINSPENGLHTEQQRYNKYNNICHVILEILKNCKHLLNKETLKCMFNFLLKVTEQYNDNKMITQVFDTLAWFPFDKWSFKFCKFEISLLKLIDLRENEVEAEEKNCNKHWKLCDTLKWIFINCRDSFSHQTCKRIFEYLIKFIRVCQFLPTDLQSPQSNLKIHQNWCYTMKDLLKVDIESKLWSHNNVNSMFDYLLQFVEQSKNMQTVLSGISLIEEMCPLKKQIDIHRRLLMKDKLQRYFCDTECPFLFDLSDDFDSVRIQVNICARWCADNLLGDDDQERNWSLVKISPDGFGAKFDRGASHFISVRSPFFVSSKIYFYEVVLLTKGHMRFGWSTGDVRLNRSNTIGDDEHSIGYDVIRNCVWHNNKFYKIQNISPSGLGDVIGCLIDFNERLFMFFINGKRTECREAIELNFETFKFEICIEKMHFSIKPYYATASLYTNEQCYFNFGQAPFKFPPGDVRFRDFHRASNGDNKRYKLSETDEFEGSCGPYYWFKNSTEIESNQIDLMYQDKISKEFKELENHKTKGTMQKIEKMNTIKIPINPFERDHKYAQYIKSIIEVAGKQLKKHKVDIVSQWIGILIEKNIDKVYEEKLLELLYPYLQIKSIQQKGKQKILCIVLSYLIKFSEDYYDFIKPIRKQVFAYLTQILTKTNDKWTQLFVMVGLKNLKLNDKENAMLKSNENILEILDTWKDNTNYQDAFKVLTSENCSLLDYQLYFVSEHFFNHVLDNCQVIQANSIALNCGDLTGQLNLSSDQFSARSDNWQRQGVRSLCDVTQGIYYFEVVLLTNGPMQIGWSTRRTNLERTEVGGDEFSVAYDGYTLSLRHDSKVHHIPNVRRWKEGDVVSCLINFSSKQFLFFLNGQPISSQSNFYFSSLPYYASVSLSPHQQVYFNFGQSQFVFPPKRIDFWDFQFRLTYNKKNASIDFGQLNAKNSIISLNSTNTYGDVSIKELLSSKILSNCITHTNQTCISSPPTLESPQASPDDSIVPSIRRPSTECQICFELTKLKLLRFVCCNKITWCLECLQQLRACPKCSRRQTINESTNNENQHLECRSCNAETSTQLLKFVCCNNLVVCLDCLSQFKACPKCAKRIVK